MVFPKNIAQKLGFDIVLKEAVNRCESEKAKAISTRIKFTDNRDLLKIWLNQILELKNLLEKGWLNLNIAIDFDLFERESKAAGFFYETETIGYIKDVFITLQKVTTFLAEHGSKYAHIQDLFENIDLDYEIIDAIDKVLGPDGEVKPNASKKLQTIQAQITKAEQSILKSSSSLFENAKSKGFLAETELGIKSGRLVLPVLSEHKRKINGVLIDQSGTGKISYIEPLELVTLNNDLAELKIKKRQEIIAILRKLTAQVVLNMDDLKKGIQRLAVFDFVRAKARLAIEWECVLPFIKSSSEVNNAKHPLLRKRLLEEGHKIVPLDYKFNDEQRIILISGPNAGGKSVALKTVGLLQYMLQCGFLIPCSEGSSFQLFKNIFIDIGDNQSIESDLSTYSSHLKAAKHIINFSDKETMVLMDEIGTGTDPTFGGPMAEAVLEFIHKKDAYGVITTHFSNIKAKAKRLDGVVNAAMLFDTEKLEPQYKLEIGQPGSSFVYELAASIGLNKKLINRAKKLTQTKQYDLDVLLAEVQNQQEKLKEQLSEAEKSNERAAHFEEEYKNLKSLLDTQKKDIIKNAEQRANAIIKAANKDIERTIREIKEGKADKAKTKKARERLKVTENKQEVIEKLVLPDFKEGDNAQIKGTETVGEIIEIKGNRVTLSIGSLTTKTKLQNLEKAGIKQKKKVEKYISKKSYSNRQENFKSELDVRGMRTYDALSAVDEWIDSALILGFSKLRLLHGKGDGILKTEIRRHLKPNPIIESITYERVDLGGEGISIIELK